jgi:tRNA1Val (adenine37-N6)-methyltransferase
MKVGTDAVLLGASVEVSGCGNILEIGTGCGVIALMLAQRSQARIDAIEIDEESVEQARENAANSPWNDRINIVHSSLQDFVKQTDKKYDLVISNPPFFTRSLKSPDEKRNISRHNDSLSFDELIDCSSQIMMPGAGLWVILPVKESHEIIRIATGAGMHLHSLYRISTVVRKSHHRNILQFKMTTCPEPEDKVIIIRNPDNTFTDDYRLLTHDFYLDF